MSVQQIYAQQTVTGKITDETNQGVPGANILKQGSNVGVTSDFDGNYSISASQGDVLVFSFVGYKTKSVTVGNNLNVNIQLEPDVASLDEVVVIGYGTAKKSDLAGAVSQVSAKSFEDQPMTRVEDALKGRASGVTVAGSGQPGSPIKVRIRGVNSITGDNNPLVVVDGVFGGDLRTINPNDIASMEILKDASALAIYGSRASNGVILVTTKKGRGGDAKISVDQFVTISSLAKSIDRLSSSQFAEAINLETPGSFTAAEIEALRANPNDWEDLTTQTGIVSNTQLSISGGDVKLNYFVSGNYIDQEGTIINTGYKRGSFRANLGAKINDKLTVNVNLYGSRDYTLNDQDAFNWNGGFLLKALTWDPTVAPQDANGDWIYRGEYANNGWNPMFELSQSVNELVSDRLNATINASYAINDNLSYSLIASGTRNNANTESLKWARDPSLGVGSDFNSASFRNFRQTTHQISNVLNWKKSFDKHNLDLTGVYEFQGARSTTNSYNANDVNVPGFYHTDNSASEFFANSGAESSIQSYLARVQYNFDNSFYLTGSIRVDESSKFKKGNRTGTFPSVAAAYSFNNSSFVEDSDVLSNLKFRAGWGQVGNENINAQAGITLTNDAGLYSFDGQSPVTGQTLTQIGNPDLKWETTTQLNVGLDYGFLNGKIRGAIDYYKKETEDLLLRRTVTGTLYSQFENVGKVENKGLDFSISADIINNDDFTWDATFNLSSLSNEVTELYDGLDQVQGNSQIIGGTQERTDIIKVGEPLGTFLGYTFLGTWKTSEAAAADAFGRVPGDPKFLRDSDGELVLGPIGNGLPSTTWGLNQTFTYKNFTLNVFINGASGFDVYNMTRGLLDGGTATVRNSVSLERLNAWTPTNETEIPRIGHVNLLNSTRWVEDGSYIRLNNVKLGYTFTELIRGVDRLEFYASGQNLLLITDYKGYDPEVSTRANPYSSGTTNGADVGTGLDVGSYPNPRTYTLGVKIQF